MTANSHKIQAISEGLLCVVASVAMLQVPHASHHWKNMAANESLVFTVEHMRMMKSWWKFRISSQKSSLVRVCNEAFPLQKTSKKKTIQIIIMMLNPCPPGKSCIAPPPPQTRTVGAYILTFSGWTPNSTEDPQHLIQPHRQRQCPNSIGYRRCYLGLTTSTPTTLKPKVAYHSMPIYQEHNRIIIYCIIICYCSWIRLMTFSKKELKSVDVAWLC